MGWVNWLPMGAIFALYDDKSHCKSKSLARVCLPFNANVSVGLVYI